MVRNIKDKGRGRGKEQKKKKEREREWDKRRRKSDRVMRNVCLRRYRKGGGMVAYHLSIQTQLSNKRAF